MAEPVKPEVAKPAPAKIAEVDLENMPKISPDAFKRNTAQPIRYKVEIVLKTANSLVFEVQTGDEAAKFVDSYQALLERKVPIARWNIGAELYAIPMDSIIMIKLHKPSVQDMVNAQSN